MRRAIAVLVPVVLIIGMVTAAQALRPPPDCGEREAERGEFVILPAGCVVHGDVEVGSPHDTNFTIVPDDDPETGMAVLCLQRCRVHFPNGGGMTAASLNKIVKDQAAKGCENGCNHGTLVMIYPRSNNVAS